MDPRALTVEFNERINDRDLDGLAKLMTDDHTFIDTADHTIRGKSECLEAWRGFFKTFPDYRAAFDWLVVDDIKAIVVGRSSCSDVRLSGPALWVVKARDDKLAEWRVYEDTPANLVLVNPSPFSTSPNERVGWRWLWRRFFGGSQGQSWGQLSHSARSRSSALATSSEALERRHWNNDHDRKRPGTGLIEELRPTDMVTDLR